MIIRPPDLVKQLQRSCKSLACGELARDEVVIEGLGKQPAVLHGKRGPRAKRTEHRMRCVSYEQSVVIRGNVLEARARECGKLAPLTFRDELDRLAYLCCKRLPSEQGRRDVGLTVK
jgi:hypothetical protein